MNKAIRRQKMKVSLLQDWVGRRMAMQCSAKAPSDEAVFWDIAPSYFQFAKGTPHLQGGKCQQFVYSLSVSAIAEIRRKNFTYVIVTVSGD